MALSANGQWEITDEASLALLLGNGTKYPVAAIDGLGLDVRAADVDRAGDGAWAGGDFYLAREVVLTVGVNGELDATAMRTLLDDVGEAMAARAADYVLRYRRFGVDRRLYVRPRGVAVPWDDPFFLGGPTIALRFRANDPFVYAESATNASPTGGGVPVANSGTIDSPRIVATLTPTGAGVTVDLSNDTTGKVVSLVNVPASTIVVDFTERTVTVAGANRADLVDGTASEWWSLPPGTSTVSASNVSSATLVTRSAWPIG